LHPSSSMAAMAAVTTTLMTTPNWRQHITDAAAAGTVLAARLRFRRDRRGVLARCALSLKDKGSPVVAGFVSHPSLKRCRRLVQVQKALRRCSARQCASLHRLLCCHRFGVSAYRRVAFAFVPCPSMS
jgi:hypothetical protein